MLKMNILLCVNVLPFLCGLVLGDEFLSITDGAAPKYLQPVSSPPKDNEQEVNW